MSFTMEPIYFLIVFSFLLLGGQSGDNTGVTSTELQSRSEDEPAGNLTDLTCAARSFEEHAMLPFSSTFVTTVRVVQTTFLHRHPHSQCVVQYNYYFACDSVQV